MPKIKPKPQPCQRCQGRGTREVTEYDPDVRMWVPADPVTCIECNGTGTQ